VTHQEFIDQYLQITKHEIIDGVLYVNDNLFLLNSHVTRLPNRLVVKGELDLQNCYIIELPYGLVVEKMLWLTGSNILSLPDNLTVGNLSLLHTRVKTLPKNLTIHNWINIGLTKINSFPNDLSLGGCVYGTNQVKMCERLQLQIIKRSKTQIELIKNPTKKVISLQKLLWEI